MHKTVIIFISLWLTGCYHTSTYPNASINKIDNYHRRIDEILVVLNSENIPKDNIDPLVSNLKKMLDQHDVTSVISISSNIDLNPITQNQISKNNFYMFCDRQDIINYDNSPNKYGVIQNKPPSFKLICTLTDTKINLVVMKFITNWTSPYDAVNRTSELLAKEIVNNLERTNFLTIPR
jgi:hypothetical protein